MKVYVVWAVWAIESSHMNKRVLDVFMSERENYIRLYHQLQIPFSKSKCDGIPNSH